MSFVIRRSLTTLVPPKVCRLSPLYHSITFDSKLIKHDRLPTRRYATLANSSPCTETPTLHFVNHLVDFERHSLPLPYILV